MAKKLKIKSPSLYNRISNLEDLKNKISLYGWKQLEEKMFLSIIEENGYEAIKSMAYAFYDYATENKGIFEVMLWYNKYMIEEGNQVTHNTFDILFKILRKLNLSDETINHFIRTLRGFLEGYVLLVNHQAFGHPLSIQKSFDFSLNILINGVKNMEEEYINITLDNIDQEHICCAISDKKHFEGVFNKKEWLKKRITEGHVFRKLNVQGKVFVEYAPLEKAWVPIEGTGFLYIYCLWVSGKFKGHGYGKQLLEYVINDAKKKGKQGVCVISSKKKKSYLADKKFFLKYGFEVVD